MMPVPGRRRSPTAAKPARAALAYPLIVFAVALGGLLAACNGKDSEPSFDGTLTVAVAVPLTGDQADFGMTIADGVELAAAQRNSQGGVDGKKVVVERFDDQASADGAKEAARQVIDSGAPVVIGHFNSSASLAAAPIYAEAGILQITPTSTNPKLTDLGIDTIFRVAPTDAAQGPYLAQLVADAGHKKAAVVFEAGNAYTEGLASTTAAGLRDEGVEVVLEKSYADTARDWSGILDAPQLDTADAIVLAADMPQAAEITLQVAEKTSLGDLPDGIALFGGDSLAKFEYPFRTGNASEGATVTALIPNLVTGDAADAELVDDYRDMFGRNPGLDTPAGMVAIQVWFRAVEDAGTTDTTAVAKTLKGGFSWSSPIGEISFDEHGDLRVQDLHAFVVQDRRFVER